MRTAGFAPLILIIITVVVTIAVIGGGYGVYKYQMTARENASLKAQVESQKGIFREQYEKSSEQSSQSGTSDMISNIIPDKEPETERTTNTKEVVYVNQYPTQSTTQVQGEVDTTMERTSTKNEEQPILVSDEEKLTQTEIKVPIKVVNLAQTSFPDSYGGVYGSYRIAIEVSPEGGDILIPPTTSDTLGSRIIGFTYSVSGDFKGTQNSEVDCGGLMNNGYCKIKDGTTKILYAQVWIYPNKDSDGNYSITFKKIRYLFNGVEKELSINSESETLNLYY